MEFFNYSSLPMALAETVASIHERIPLSWDPLRTVSPEKVLQTQMKLISIDVEQVIIVVLNEGQELIGFHWVTLRDNKALIHSTWINKFQRRLGISKSLKGLGEAWVVRQKKSTIISKVHIKNLNMQALNNRCGYAIIKKDKEFLIFQKNIIS